MGETRHPKTCHHTPETSPPMTREHRTHEKQGQHWGIAKQKQPEIDSGMESNEEQRIEPQSNWDHENARTCPYKPNHYQKQYPRRNFMTPQEKPQSLFKGE